MLAILFTLLIPTSFAAPAKLTCSERELRGQDCRLGSGTYKIRLLAATIARDDGTWHTVDAMPLTGEGIVWEKITFDYQHGLPMLQFWLWDVGTGQAQVQSLRWYVTDARKGALNTIAQGVVRRRRLKPAEDPTKNEKPVYLYDRWEKHSAQITKAGKIDWQLGSLKKTFDPDQAHAPAVAPAATPAAPTHAPKEH